ncbi:hypothetical protein BDZ45DRAFT_806486 [Acephala macrosclerotiorum]|nr:hypothetical protein BDZ45DRAFT_806486 [Acephala macrosclerotiorum]
MATFHLRLTHTLIIPLSSQTFPRPGIPSVLIEAGTPIALPPSPQSQNSSPPSSASTPTTALAMDVQNLLLRIFLDPHPSSLGHSYGGVLIREFLALRNSDVNGLIFVDAVMEDDLDYEWPNRELGSLKRWLDSYVVGGIKENSKLSNEEWEKFVEGEEAELFEEATKNQIRNKVFGIRRLFIIKADHVRDYQTILEAGIKAGNGTEEEREKLRTFCDGIDKMWKKNQRKLIDLCEGSWRFKGVACGHQVHIEMPGVVVEGAEWVLGPLWWEVK